MPERARKRGRKPKVRPGAVLLKYFRDIASADLNALFPDVKVVMGFRDRLMLGVPALIGGVPILLKLASTLTVLFLVAGFYLGLANAVAGREMAGALAAVSGLVALGGFMVTQWVRFQRQSLIHQKILSDNVYYRNVNNNAGIFDYIIGEAEEQECKEAFLAYYFLLAPGDGPTEDALDRRIEAWLKQTFGADIDFECDDALAKLDRLGLLRRDGDRLSVPPLDEALVRLDRIWDNFFPFDGERRYRAGSQRRLARARPHACAELTHGAALGDHHDVGSARTGRDASALAIARLSLHLTRFYAAHRRRRRRRSSRVASSESVCRDDAVEQRRQHVVRHIGDQPDVVVLEHFQKGIRPGHSPQLPRQKRHLSITRNARQ